MDNTSGALSFDAVVNQTDFIESVNDMEKRIKSFASSTEKAGDQMDDTFKKIYKGVEDFTGVTSENLQIQRNVIKEIESNLKTIKERLEDVGPGKARMEVAAQYRELNAELEREKQALSDLEGAVKQSEAAHSSLYGQLRKIRDEMATMEASGQRNTEQYRQMQQEAGRLTEALADVNRQTRIIGSSGAWFQGIISGLGGVAGAFSAAQGTAGMFARENENLQKIMLKVQSLLAITIGLQQVQHALDKDQAFMLVVVRKAKDALTASTYKLATALGISNVAAKVLMGTLTLGLSVAITALIAVWSRYSAAQAKARAEDKQFNEAVAENASKTIATFKQLQTSYTALGNDMKAKEKFIKSNAEEFEKLGVQVDTVSDAENVLVKNAGAFEQAMMLKAKAIAAMDLAAESYKGYLQEMAQAESDLVPWLQNAVTAMGGGASGILASIENIAMTSPEKRMFNSEELKKRGDKYVGLYQGFNNEIDSLNEKFDFRITPDSEKQQKEKDEFIENLNSIKAQYELYTKWISSKDQFLRETARYQFSSLLQNGASYLEYLTRERDALLSISDRTKEQEENLRKLNDAIAELSKIPVVKDETGDLFSATLKKKKAEYDRFLSWISSSDTILQDSARTEFAGLLAEGENYLEFLIRQRDALLAKTSRTKAEDARLVYYNDEIAQATKGGVLDDFQKKLDEQIKGAASVLEVIKLIEAERNKITGTTDLEKEQQEILDKAMQDAQKRSKDETQALLHDYGGYLSEKLDFDKNYLNNKAALTTAIANATSEEERKAYEAALEGLEERRLVLEKAVATELQKKILTELGLLDVYAGKGTDYIKDKVTAVIPAFENLASLTSKELKKAKEVIKDIELTPEQFEALKNAGVDVEKLKKALEDLKRTSNEAIDETEWEKLSNILNGLSSGLYALGSSLQKSGGALGEIGEGLSGISEGIRLMTVALDENAKTGDLIGAGLQGIATIYSMIAGQQEENRRKQEEWTAAIMESAHQMALLRIEAYSYKPSNIFGVESPYEKAIKGALEYSQAMTELIDMADELANSLVQVGEKQVLDAGNIITGTAAGAGIGAAVGSVIPVIGTFLGAAIGAIFGAAAGAVATKTVPIFETLKEKYGEIYDPETFELNPEILADYAKLDEATQKLVDNWEEIRAKALEAQEQMREAFDSLAGDIGDSLSDALIKAFKNGDIYDAIDDFHDAVTKTIEDIIAQLIFASIFQKYFDQLGKDFEASFAEGGDMTIVDDILRFTQKWTENIALYNQAMLDAQAAMKEQGFDIFQPEIGEASMTGAIKGVSEETASLIAGQMNAIRLNQAQSLDLLRQHLIALSGIKENTDVLPDILPESLNQLRTIASNTTGAMSLFTGTGIKVKY